MTAATTYTVWRRLNDGYVGCSATHGRPWGAHGGTGPGDAKPTTFKVLLVTNEWPKAHALMEGEHAKPKHKALMASWAAYNASEG